MNTIEVNEKMKWGTIDIGAGQARYGKPIAYTDLLGNVILK